MTNSITVSSAKRNAYDDRLSSSFDVVTKFIYKSKVEVIPKRFGLAFTFRPQAEMCRRLFQKPPIVEST